MHNNTTHNEKNKGIRQKYGKYVWFDKNIAKKRALKILEI